MDLLESAVIMVPALTGMDLTVYHGEPQVLARFESKYCLSRELQPLYTQKGLSDFLEGASESVIYNVEEVLGTRLIAARIGVRWILLGPYVEEGWSERSSRVLLVNLGISEAILPQYKAYRCNLPIMQRDLPVKTAFLLAEHMGCGPKALKTVQWQTGHKGACVELSGVYANAVEINRRYHLEDSMIAAISQGDTRKALKTREEFGTAMSGIRFLSDSMQDHLAGAAINRTIIRFGAKLGGLSPVLIDSISQEYAQRMQRTASKEELDRLTRELIVRFCGEVNRQRRAGWSPAVRRAADYMQVNLSKTMTTAEIARAAGVDRHRLTKDFSRETGKTMKQYLSERRCEVAAQLLLDSSAGVQEIAAYVGYEDTNYFSKVFKAINGVPPQVYRTLRAASSR